MRLKRLAMLLVMLPAMLGTAARARAALLDDFLARGYVVAAATVLPGLFTGCVRTRRLNFADGSSFACAQTGSQTGYASRVTILQLRGMPPSVLLVGSRVMAGELLRLRLHDYPVPLRMNPDPLAPGRPPVGAALTPIGAIPSIDTVTRQLSAPLQQQQDRIAVVVPKRRTGR